MPSLDFKGRTLFYSTFGSQKWDAQTPVFIAMSTEHRDTATLAAFYNEFPETFGGIILDNTNMGQASRLDRPLQPEELLEEIRFVCDSLSIARPILVSYCSNAELSLWCAERIDNAAAVLISPLVRWGGGAFVDFLYAAMKRPTLEKDAYTLSVIMTLVDPHARGFREQRNYFLSEQFAYANLLQEPEHFWIKTLQNKPVGLFDWEKMPEFERPVLVLRGAHDPVQPGLYLRGKLTGEQHRLVEYENSHRILDDQREHVISEMCAFAAALSPAPALSDG